MPLLRALRCLTLASLLATSSASAQEQPDAAARVMYVKGERAYERGLYEDAVLAFRRSYEISRRPLILRSIGLALERLGRYTEAAEAYREYARAVPSASAEIEEYICQRFATCCLRARKSAAHVASGT